MPSNWAWIVEAPGPAVMRSVDDGTLPPGDVTVDVSHSSLNYKDALAVTGKGKIVRSYPMVCGIDLCGTVHQSDTEAWRPGDPVIVTGFGLSESHPGGFTQRQRVRSEWLVRRPDPFSAVQAMAVGTAGLTAMLCVLGLERAGVRPGRDREVLVTGAGGGVGSLSVILLSRLGHRVTASTGRSELEGYLRGLGAAEVVGRDELAFDDRRPFWSERWAGVVDPVGGRTLGAALQQTAYRGSVAACGLAGGTDLPTTVFPFIIRGVNLLGIDSVLCPMEVREEAWARLATDMPTELLDEVTTVAPMTEVAPLSEKILAGAIRGRIVVDVGA